MSSDDGACKCHLPRGGRLHGSHVSRCVQDPDPAFAKHAAARMTRPPRQPSSAGRTPQRQDPRSARNAASI
jgi:hypothetical protein